MKNNMLILLLALAIVSCSPDDKGKDNGEFKDHRDNKYYKWVAIGEKVWMAENLNYSGNDLKGESWCNNCSKYGRLYDWEAAMSACPDGWHLSSNDEWHDAVDSASTSLSLSLGGRRYEEGMFFDAGNVGYWWTATESIDTSNAVSGAYFWRYESGKRASVSNFSKVSGFSVRCVRDLPESSE